MEGVHIVSDNTSLMKETVQQLSIPEPQVIDYEKFEQEVHLHDWITNKFKGRGIKKLILPAAIPTTGVLNSEGLKIVLHLRLNYELSIEERSIPIVLLSDFSLDIIVAKNSFDKDTNPQNLFFTKGIQKASFDCEVIIKKLKNTQNISKNEYNQDVLGKLKITRKASDGKHSIANAWGCFKLSLVTGLRKEVFELEGFSSMLKTLYAKYLICSNDAYSGEKRIDLNPLKCSGKKVLFIDDLSDEGWAVLMKGIFKGAENTFVSVDSSKYKNAETKQFHDFEGFMTKCRSHIGKDWDLIIIDLRLNPGKEDIDNEMISPTEFSGYKLIDEYLNGNEGYQIIVSTASNKIWNINSTLERGASSYYVKESPEFNYSISETNKHYENFKRDVHKCFKRSYLRDIYKDNQQLIQNLNRHSTSNFFNAIKNQLTLAYFLLKDAKSDVQFAYAYISLYMVIEIVNNELLNKTRDDKWDILGIGNLLDWKWDTNSNTYSNSGIEVVGNKPPEWHKFAGIYFQKWNLSDNNFIQQLYFLITKRNGFVHNDKSILDRQDINGRYLNHDIYTNEGYEKLFKLIKDIVGNL